MPIHQPPSPLDNISNLKQVSPEKVKELEDRLAARLPKVRKLLLEQQEAANRRRHTIIG